MWEIGHPVPCSTQIIVLRRRCHDEIFESCDSVQWQNGHNQKREKRCLNEPNLPNKKSSSHGSVPKVSLLYWF